MLLPLAALALGVCLAHAAPVDEQQALRAASDAAGRAVEGTLCPSEPKKCGKARALLGRLRNLAERTLAASPEPDAVDPLNKERAILDAEATDLKTTFAPLLKALEERQRALTYDAYSKRARALSRGIMALDVDIKDADADTLIEKTAALWDEHRRISSAVDAMGVSAAQSTENLRFWSNNTAEGLARLRDRVLALNPSARRGPPYTMLPAPRPTATPESESVVGAPERRGRMARLQKGNTCAIAAQAQVLAEYGVAPHKKGGKAEDKLFKEAVEAGLFSGSGKEKKRRKTAGTPSQFGAALLERHGILVAKRVGAEDEELLAAVARGGMIVAYVDSGSLWKRGRADGKGHSIVITGAKREKDGRLSEIYFNDPATGRAGHTWAPYFLRAWRDAGAAFFEPL